mmetsp:Transcript_18883/g.47921  ORF Transcript_18883/g.47921 Transcript_18883/m.47921 type:complete len:212 (+) Transcript_18883:1630-2265(+)
MLIINFTHVSHCINPHPAPCTEDIKPIWEVCPRTPLNLARRTRTQSMLCACTLYRPHPTQKSILAAHGNVGHNSYALPPACPIPSAAHAPDGWCCARRCDMPPCHPGWCTHQQLPLHGAVAVLVHHLALKPGPRGPGGAGAGWPPAAAGPSKLHAQVQAESILGYVKQSPCPCDTTATTSAVAWLPALAAAAAAGELRVLLPAGRAGRWAG